MNVIEKGGGPDVEEAGCNLWNGDSRGPEGIAFFSQHNPNDVRAPRGSIDMNVTWHRFTFVQRRLAFLACSVASSPWVVGLKRSS